MGGNKGLCLIAILFSRPLFSTLEQWLEGMSVHLGVKNRLPQDLVDAIHHFSSQSDEDDSSPEVSYLKSPFPLLRTVSEQGSFRLSTDSSATAIDL